MADSVLVRLTRIGAALLLALLAVGGGLCAQELSRVTVRVVDQASKRGIALARVIVSGPVQRFGYTDETGSVTIDGLPAGLYRMTVVAPAFQLGRAELTVREGETLAVDAALVSTAAPKAIGSVTVHSTPTSGVTDYSSGGAVRSTNQTLPDTLRFDPSASVGPDGSISLDGQSASATGYTLDGIPLGGGGGFDARRINADLFSSVAVSHDPANGATAGSVDLRSFEPTIGFQTTLAGRTASNGDGSLSSIFTGSTGNLGYAFGAAVQGTDGPLEDQRFADTSGLDVLHQDATRTDGLLAKLRIGLSATQSLSVTGLRQTSQGDEVCDAFGTALPCGWGPGNGTTSSLSVLGATYAALFDKLSLQVVPYVRTDRYDQDLLDQIDFGVPAPASATVSSSTRGVRIGATFDASAATQYQFSGSASTTQYDSLASDGVDTVTTALDRLFEDVAIGARVRVNSTLSLTPDVRYTRADALGHGTTDLTANWSPSRTDTYTASLSPRRYGIGEAFTDALSAPSSLQFDCDGQDALASGAGEPATDPASSQARVTWQHRDRRIRTIVSAYRTHLTDALIPGYVNAGGLGTLVPPGYLASANAYAHLPSACGATAAPLTLADVMVQQPVTVPAETAQGFNLAVSATLARGLVLVPSYTATYATANVLGPEFAAPRSVLIPGAQLPGIPMHRWSLIADYAHRRGGPEEILTFQHVDANNPYWLPAYTVVGAGMAFPTPYGRLILSGYNLTNRFALPFASAADAVSLATNNGAPFAVLAQQLPPRNVTAAYSFTLGTGAATRPVATTSGLDQAAANSVFRYDIDSLPTTAPSLEAGLRADPQAPSCVPEALRDADPLLRDLRTYVNAIGVAHDPSSVAVPHIPGVTIAYHALAAGYELLLTLDRRASLAVGRCGHFVYADRDQAQQLGLGQRVGLASWQLDFRYEPRFGLFLVERDTSITSHANRPPLPSTPPANPFVPVDGPRCTRAERPAIADLLGQLAPAFAADTTTRTPAFTVTPHGPFDARWYDVVLADPLLVAPLLDCAPIADGSRAALQALGIDGRPLPAVNYAARVGWYVAH